MLYSSPSWNTTKFTITGISHSVVGNPECRPDGYQGVLLPLAAKRDAQGRRGDHVQELDGRRHGLRRVCRPHRLLGTTRGARIDRRRQSTRCPISRRMTRSRHKRRRTAQVGVFYPNSRTTVEPDHRRRFAHHHARQNSSGCTTRVYARLRIRPITRPALTSNDGWAVGGVPAFSTATPAGAIDQGQPGGLNNQFFESAGSQHPSGANFAAVDGSVPFRQ